MRRLLPVLLLVLAGCTQTDPPPPWDQEALFEQAAARIQGIRVIDRRLLAWGTEFRDTDEVNNPLRIDHALLWYEVLGSAKGRYLVVPASRSSLPNDAAWSANSAIADDFINGRASIVWRYEYFATQPKSEDLQRMARFLRFRDMPERHVMPQNWHFVTGENAPTL